MIPTISLSEVKNHNNAKSTWVIIHNEVYDLTKFLDEHPGGADSLLEVAGQDGTQGFEDVGHSEDAREMMMKYKIGILPPNEHQKPIALCPKLKSCSSCMSETSCPRLPICERSSTTKPWRTFDGSSGRSSGRSSGSRSPSKVHSTSSSPKIERRVQTIHVPMEPRTSDGSGRWKWAILALAGAIIIGITLKKYYGS